MGDGYQLCCLFSQIFARSELRTSSPRETSGGTLKQSLANVNNQFIDFWELFRLNSTTMARSSLGHALKLRFIFKYAATHILIGLSVATFHQ